MAEGFLGGLLGGIGDAAQGVGSSLSGLLGGGQPSSGQSQDPLSQMSPEEQRRLSYSALGQLGAILLAAGQKQTPAQRGQILSQLGGIGPGMEQQIARSAALRGQQAEAAQRRELFPLQKQQMLGQLEQQRLAGMQTQQQMVAARQAQAMQFAKLQRDIQFLESQGLDASGPRSQLQIMQGAGGGMPGAPATGAMPGAPAAPSQGTGYVPSAAVAGTAVSEEGFTPGAGGVAPITPQQAQSGTQSVLSQFPYLSGPVVTSALQQSSDPAKTIADLQVKNEQAKLDQFKFEGELRKEYMPSAEKFADVQKTFKTMGTLAKQGTGSADIMLITQLYKLYDPTSVVSVTETGQIQVSGGRVAALESFVNKFNGKGVLTDELRQQIVDTGLAKFTDAYKDHNKRYDDANKRAARMGVNLPSAVPDVRDPELAQEMDLMIQRKGDITRASKIAKPEEIVAMDADMLQLFDRSVMTKGQLAAVDARLKQLQQAAAPKPPVPPPAIPQPGVVSPSTMPLGASSFMRQRYPSRPGLRREDELPPAGF
ncbi:hypothetical protein K0U83_15930 [bacterium]|nr:hypothetical protein [bacterium]